ncbi:hypothetical protein HPHPH42_0975 [Helicobacter pylori Hp H-42]|uniref:Uncharacterized protein n=1 Tax=Helicobacter pylori Hp H-42 TaxID=992047 RepID=A0AB33XHV4_HELPX|nr:hypothetical protein HPHPH42_0975 [Helicobacter pylori Hp H-42]
MIFKPIFLNRIRGILKNPPLQPTTKNPLKSAFIEVIACFSQAF